MELPGIPSAQVSLQAARGELHLLSCTPAQQCKSKKGTKATGARRKEPVLLPVFLQRPLLIQADIVLVGRGGIW